MSIEPTTLRTLPVTAVSPVSAPAARPAAAAAAREPLVSLLDKAPAVSPTIRLDPPTGVVVTRWYEGPEVANQIPTPRQLDAYRFGQQANGLLRGTGETEPSSSSG